MLQGDLYRLGRSLSFEESCSQSHVVVRYRDGLMRWAIEWVRLGEPVLEDEPWLSVNGPGACEAAWLTLFVDRWVAERYVWDGVIDEAIVLYARIQVDHPFLRHPIEERQAYAFAITDQPLLGEGIVGSYRVWVRKQSG